MFRPTSQRMLELTDNARGASTREIVEAIWPDTFRMENGRKRNDKLQHLLAKTRNALVIHERQGRVRQSGHAHGTYNNSRSIIWKITNEGREWLKANDPEKKEASRAAARAITRARTARQDFLRKLLTDARESYGPGTSPTIRREVSRLLRAEGCTLQSIADVFKVTRELIRMDCKDAPLETYKLSLEERFTLLADLWEEETKFESSATAMADHPAYQEIIRLGPPVVPVILQRMREQGGHWFFALYSIVGEDHAQGETTVSGATEAWINWGIKKGHIPA